MRVLLYILCVILGTAQESQSVVRAVPPGSEHYIALDRMIIPIVQARVVRGFVSCTVVLDCQSTDVRKALARFTPLLQDRIFWDLYVILGLVWRRNYRIDIESIKKRVRNVIAETTDPEFFRDVLITDFHNHERTNTVPGL